MRALLKDIEALPLLTRFGRVARIEGLAVEVTGAVGAVRRRFSPPPGVPGGGERLGQHLSGVGGFSRRVAAGVDKTGGHITRK